MENASKALLIAASVLIVILLIGVGMVIFNSIGSTTDQVGSQADSMAIQTFNGNFDQYEGSAVSASNVKSLINKINANNVNSSNKVRIKGEVNASAKIDTTKTSGIVNSHKYTVTMNKHIATSCPCGHAATSEGYICLITINDNNVSGEPATFAPAAVTNW